MGKIANKEFWNFLPEWQQVMNSILNEDGEKEACKSDESNTPQTNKQGVVHE